MWTVLGPEFGDNAGKSASIVRVWHRMKTADASFRAYLVQCMNVLGYSVDWALDYTKRKFWIKFIHLGYVDYILCIHHNLDDLLDKQSRFILLKSESVHSPNMHLSTKLKMMQLTIAYMHCLWVCPSMSMRRSEFARNTLLRFLISIVDCQRGQTIHFVWITVLR